MSASALALGQADNARAEVFRLQLQRFEGVYRLSGAGNASGSMDFTNSSKGGDCTVSGTVSGKKVELHATTAFDPADKKEKATIEMDGRTFKGTPTIDGRDFLIEARDGKTVRRFRLHLSGRAQGTASLTQQEDGKAETPMFDLTMRRTT